MSLLIGQILQIDFRVPQKKEYYLAQTGKILICKNTSQSRRAKSRRIVDLQLLVSFKYTGSEFKIK